jgi:hypothetical protein
MSRFFKLALSILVVHSSLSAPPMLAADRGHLPKLSKSSESHTRRLHTASYQPRPRGRAVRRQEWISQQANNLCNRAPRRHQIADARPASTAVLPPQSNQPYQARNRQYPAAQKVRPARPKIVCVDLKAEDLYEEDDDEVDVGDIASWPRLIEGGDWVFEPRPIKFKPVTIPPRTKEDELRRPLTPPAVELAEARRAFSIKLCGLLQYEDLEYLAEEIPDFHPHRATAMYLMKCQNARHQYIETASDIYAPLILEEVQLGQ